LKKLNFHPCGIFPIFFLLFSLCVNSCADTKAQNDFYKGLVSKKNNERTSEIVRLFESALESSNEFVRQAAAEELANLMFDGTEISARTTRRIQREAGGLWAEAFRVFDGEPVKEKALDFLFNFEQNTPARLFVLRECEKKEIIFTGAELAAMEGHLAISSLRYNEALLSFRTFQEDGNWPQSPPRLFLDYPVLISDLGRAFQYTSSGTEGLNLFLQWENSSPDIQEDIRFRLLFLSARIARRNGLSEQAALLFEKALAFAPDNEQSDASIWYILDISMADTSDIFIEKLNKFILSWHNGNYYNDILERFLQTLVSRQDWKKIIRVYSMLQNTGAAIKAGYAWVIGRVIEEKLLINEEMILAAQTANSESPPSMVSFFKRAAYNALGDDVSSLLYYRSLSASVLGEPFLVIPSETEDDGKNLSPALQFLLGFFSHNADEYGYDYILRMEQDLSPDELRAAALVLQQTGMYFQSMRMATRYVNREGHKLNRQDLELLFPRAYKELVEKYAEETGVLPEILFALIRTESAFQSDIVSRAGAVGLTQLLQETALEMTGRIRRAGGPDYNALDLTDPGQNIHIGAYYLNYLTGRFEDQLLSLLAYNGGMNRVRRWRAASSYPVDLFLETITLNETRDYGRKVMSAAAVYKDLYYK
jgi:soluble lytic murein transglycosylase